MSEYVESQGANLANDTPFDRLVERWCLVALPMRGRAGSYTCHITADEIDLHDFGGCTYGVVCSPILATASTGQIRTRSKWYELAGEPVGLDGLSDEARYWLKFYAEREGVSVDDFVPLSNPATVLASQFPKIPICFKSRDIRRSL